MTREGAPKGAHLTTGSNDQGHRTASAAESEARCRLHSVAVVSEALADGRWELDVEVLDELGALVDAAGRWALVAELEAVAA